MYALRDFVNDAFVSYLIINKDPTRINMLKCSLDLDTLFCLMCVDAAQNWLHHLITGCRLVVYPFFTSERFRHQVLLTEPTKTESTRYPFSSVFF